MYAIANPRMGQRVTVWDHPMVGTIVAILGNSTKPNIVIVWDNSPVRYFYYLAEVAALTPGNEDGYFDGPAGYGGGS